MLMAFHHFGTTNEADKVFALLGLATDTTDTMLNPDYTISVEDVYIKTARHLLLRDQSILILHRAGVGFPNRNETLPSWVPDWRSFSEDNSFGTMHTIAGYRAGGEHTSGVSIGSTNDSLVFEGLLVDVVEQVGSVRTPLTDKVDHTVHQHNSEFFAWLIEAESMVEKLENRKATPLGTAAWYSKNETLNDALCRTLVANNILTNPSKLREHCGFWGQHIANLAENVSEPMSEERWKVVVAYDDACTRTTMGRKFFITRNGFMGVTSPGTLPGDAVAIFLGGKTPFITRDSLHAQGGHAFSTLVGEAYVHGLMKGEGLDLAQVRELEFR
ncbi:hypothetical protein F5882DRAFT_387543 [Hyaloscypha sp. PMI_1271]|nr:hypothetical protein F5882DRAFT_387543 [Hyaloscypha sp. PMI_1271]